MRRCVRCHYKDRGPDGSSSFVRSSASCDQGPILLLQRSFALSLVAQEAVLKAYFADCRVLKKERKARRSSSPPGL